MQSPDAYCIAVYCVVFYLSSVNKVSKAQIVKMEKMYVTNLDAPFTTLGL